MSTQYRVQHRTTYTYENNVSLSQQLLRLSPRATPAQSVISPVIMIEPAPMARRSRTDYFGNLLTQVSIQEPHKRLSILASSSVVISPPVLPALQDSPPWESVRDAVHKPATHDAAAAASFCFASPYVGVPANIKELLADLFTPERPILDAVLALTSRIFHDFTYKGGVTDIWTPVARVLEMRQGVCQDFAHLQIAALRSIGLPAKYVSGYLLTHPAPGKERLIGSDESHAWLSVWIPTLGWVDFDPTNNSIPTNEHIVLAWGRDYGDVSPIKGFIVGGGAHKLDVSVDVAPVTDLADIASMPGLAMLDED